MAKDLTTIKQEAQQVQNATQVGENTAQRVGGVLVDIVDKMGVLDTVPTSGSTNPVTSGGIRTAMDEQEDKLNTNTGVDKYPAFSASTTYAIGDVVNYNGKLYKFTADHAAGAWTGSDVEETDAVKAHIVQELGDNEDKVVSQKAVSEAIYATQEQVTELDNASLFKKGQTLNENAINVANLVKKIFIINRDESKTYKLKSIQFNTEYSGQGNFFGQIDILNGTEIEKSIYFSKIPFSWDKKIIEVYTDIYVLLDNSSSLWGSETILLSIDMELSDMSSIEEMLFKEWITAQQKTQEELTTTKTQMGKSIQENKENIIKCLANIIFVKTKGNLVNPKAVKKGYYIDNNGNIKEAADIRWSVSNYILCNGQNITSNGDTTFNTYNVYNEKGLLIRSEKGSMYEYVDGDYAVIISFYNKDNQWMANYGDILLQYEPYYDIFEEVSSLKEECEGLNNTIESYKNDVYETTISTELVDSITLTEFTEVGVLKTDGKLYDASLNPGFSDYRVTPFMDVASIDKVTYTELIPIRKYSSIALYTDATEDSFVGYVSERSGEILLADYPTAKYLRACTYYSLQANINLYTLKEETSALPLSNKDRILMLEKRIYGTKVLIVDKNGNGDFTNLDDALDNANDSKESPTTIFIMPGIYEMKEWNNDYKGKKDKRNLNIIGINPYQCILTNNKGAYNYNTGETYVDNACLKIAGNCLIKNLSFISTSEYYNEDLHGEDWKRSYCVHCDAPAEDGDVLWIDNCYMSNDHFSCIGCGHRTGYTIKITNCEFDYTSAYPNWDFASAIYVHDKADMERQKIELLHNIIRTTNANGIYVDCGIGGTQIDCLFIGNAISVPSDKKAYDKNGNPIINSLSFNNNNNDMNYSLVE